MSSSSNSADRLWDALAVAVRFRQLFAALLLLSAIVVLLGLLALPRPYTVRATIRPQGATVASAGQLSSLAAQFGVVVPGGDGVDSPAFFVEYLQSWVVGYAVAGSRVEFEEGKYASLADYLEIEEQDSRLRQEKARRWLDRRAVRVGMGRESGTVTIEVRTQSPYLSRSIASAYITLADSFNVENRKLRANFERLFVEGQVRAAYDSLLLSEDSLRSFLRINRQYELSPDLRFEYERRQRAVQMRQQLYTGLVQALEQARLSESRDTPVLARVQDAYLPPARERLRGSFLALVVLALTSASSLACLIVIESVSDWRADGAALRHRIRTAVMRVFKLDA